MSAIIRVFKTDVGDDMYGSFDDTLSQEDFSKIFAEEDAFPHLFAATEEREWDVLFYDEENKLSYGIFQK